MSETTATTQATPPVAAAYESQSVINNAFIYGGQGAAFGLLGAAIQNSLNKHRGGAIGTFTRHGGIIGSMAAVGAAYGLTRAFTANVRKANDPTSAAAGACAAGAVIGARVGSFPLMASTCVGLAAIAGTFETFGQSLGGFGWAKDFLTEEAPAPTNNDEGQDETQQRRRRSFFKPRKVPQEPQEQEES